MYENVTVNGIVLDTSLLKEYDKRLVILTSELGKITVFANGARRKNSQFTAVSQRFVMGCFTVRPGRNSYTLVSADIKENFMELSGDIEKMAYASYACEVLQDFSEEGIGAKDELNLLYVTFRAVINARQDLRLIKTAFILKLMDIEGLGLQMERCVKSDITEGLHHISLKDGGLISDAVMANVTGARPISDDAIYAVRFIFSRDIASVYSFDISISVLDEIEKLADDYLAMHSERNYKSLDILKGLL
ncbi:MAG TPA: DNA repair protein RecO [Lachnospiraceae bacterium]|nr:DNA repair protein RecO [Lachnospiraceae bacterium]